MPQGRRVERISSLIRREIGEMLINEIRDERIHQGMVTITDVEVSGDLQHCKVFVSIFGNDSEKNTVLDGLRAATGFIRGEIGRRIQMRRAPEIRFAIDKGLEKGTEILQLLEKLEKERKTKE